MGLFIGASLLTILEILDYLCEVGGPGPQLGEGEESRHSIAGWGPPPALLVSRCSGTESWVVSSGTESAPRGPPAPIW